MSIRSLLFLFLCTGCTINFIQTDTHGQSEDVVDSIPTNDIKADPEISLQGHAI